MTNKENCKLHLMFLPSVTFQYHFFEVMAEALYAIIVHLMIHDSHALGNNHVRLQFNNSKIHQHKLYNQV